MLPFTGFTWLYAIDTVTLFATLYAVVLLPRIPVEGAGSKVPGLRSVWDGFAYLRHQPVLMMSFVVDLIAMVFAMPRALFPQIAHESFGGPSEGGIASALLFAAIPPAVIVGIFSGWVSRIEAQGRVVIYCIGVGPRDHPVRAHRRVRGSRRGQAHHDADAGARGVLHDGRRRRRRGLRGHPMSILRRRPTTTYAREQGVFTVVVVAACVADVLHGGAAAVVGTAIATTGGGLLNLLGIALCALLVPISRTGSTGPRPPSTNLARRAARAGRSAPAWRSP